MGVRGAKRDGYWVSVGRAWNNPQQAAEIVAELLPEKNSAIWKTD
jgi:hypothetical protein